MAFFFYTDSKLRLDLVFPRSVRSNHTVCSPSDRIASLVIKACFLSVPPQFPPSQYSCLSFLDAPTSMHPPRYTCTCAHTHAPMHIPLEISDGCSPLMRESSSRHLHESCWRVWRDYLSTVNMDLMGQPLISSRLIIKTCLFPAVRQIAQLWLEAHHVGSSVTLIAQWTALHIPFLHIYDGRSSV